MTSCSVCLENFDCNDTIKLHCNHSFHKDCLEKWTEYNSCPICRNPIDYNKPIQKLRVDNINEDEQFAERLQFTLFDPDEECDRNERERKERERKENECEIFCTNCRELVSVETTYSCPICGENYYCSMECEEEYKNKHVCIPN